MPPLPIRAQIRARTTEILGALPPFGGHVFNARGVPLRRDLLPAVRIFCDNDTRTAANQAHALGWFIGDMQLKVQVVAEAPSDPTAADRTDQYCALVEAALLSDAVWLGLVPQVDGIETTIELDGEGEQRTVTATLDWSIRYQDCVQRDFPDVLQSILLSLDFIDPPADPNTEGHPVEPPDGYPGGYPGPDGRIELRAEFTLEQPETGLLLEDMTGLLELEDGNGLLVQESDQ